MRILVAVGISHEPQWCLRYGRDQQHTFLFFWGEGCFLPYFVFCLIFKQNLSFLVYFVRFVRSLLQAPLHPVVPGPPCSSLSWDFLGAAGCLVEPNAVDFFVVLPNRAIWGFAEKGTVLSKVLLAVFMF